MIRVTEPTTAPGAVVFLDTEDNQIIEPAEGLQRLRRQLGMSVAEFAQLVGKSKRTIEGYEQGRAPDKTVLLLLLHLPQLAAGEECNGE